MAAVLRCCRLYTETLNRLRAYRVALNFGYKVFLIHKMYAEDMLGHVGEVKRSDYNVAQCQSKRSDVNAKTYGTLNQMRMLETADFEERLNTRSLVPNVGQWPLASKLPKDRQMMAWAQRRTIALTGCATQGQATVLRATRTIRCCMSRTPRACTSDCCARFLRHMTWGCVPCKPRGISIP